MNHGTKMDIEPHNQNRLATISTMSGDKTGHWTKSRWF